MAKKKARQAKGTAASPPVPNGGELAVPPVRRPNGQRAPQAAPAPPPVEPSLADEPGSVVDRQGKLYVDGDA